MSHHINEIFLSENEANDKQVDFVSIFFLVYYMKTNTNRIRSSHQLTSNRNANIFVIMTYVYIGNSFMFGSFV